MLALSGSHHFLSPSPEDLSSFLLSEKACMALSRALILELKEMGPSQRYLKFGFKDQRPRAEG